MVTLFTVGVPVMFTPTVGRSSDKPPSVQASVPVVAGITNCWAGTGSASPKAAKAAADIAIGGGGGGQSVSC